MHSVKKLLLVFCITLSALAHADDDYSALDDSKDDSKYKSPVYHLNDDLYLTSKKDVKYERPRIVIKIVYPYLYSQDEYGTESYTVQDNVEDFNQKVSDLVADEISRFQSRVQENASLQKSLARVKNDFYVDYNMSYLKSGKHPIVSIRFSFQGYIAGMAHPYHYHRVLNYDLNYSQELDLSDLFRSDVNYLSLLSRYGYFILTKRLQNRDMIAEGTTPKPNNFVVWNIKPNGILLTFEEYQVAPYINGAQTVLVPYVLLKNLIGPQSPIAYCVKNPRSCRYSNILTGGFIDEAVNLRYRRFNPILSQL